MQNKGAGEGTGLKILNTIIDHDASPNLDADKSVLEYSTMQLR